MGAQYQQGSQRGTGGYAKMQWQTACHSPHQNGQRQNRKQADTQPQTACQHSVCDLQ